MVEAAASEKLPTEEGELFGKAVHTEESKVLLIGPSHASVPRRTQRKLSTPQELHSEPSRTLPGETSSFFIYKHVFYAARFK